MSITDRVDSIVSQLMRRREEI